MFSEAEEDRDWRLYAGDMTALAVMTKNYQIPPAHILPLDNAHPKFARTSPLIFLY